MYGINGNHKKYYKTLTINCKLIKYAKHNTVVWKHVKSDNEPDRQEANKIQVLYLYVEFDFSSKNRCCAAHRPGGARRGWTRSTVGSEPGWTQA